MIIDHALYKLPTSLIRKLARKIRLISDFVIKLLDFLRVIKATPHRGEGSILQTFW
jgi:hypothetical protein